jgi:hypothetical protein
MGAASVVHAAPGQQEENVPVSVPKPAPNAQHQAEHVQSAAGDH